MQRMQYPPSNTRVYSNAPGHQVRAKKAHVFHLRKPIAQEYAAQMLCDEAAFRHDLNANLL